MISDSPFHPLEQRPPMRGRLGQKLGHHAVLHIFLSDPWDPLCAKGLPQERAWSEALVLMILAIFCDPFGLSFQRPLEAQ